MGDDEFMGPTPSAHFWKKGLEWRWMLVPCHIWGLHPPPLWGLPASPPPPVSFRGPDACLLPCPAGLSPWSLWCIVVWGWVRERSLWTATLCSTLFPSLLGCKRADLKCDLNSFTLFRDSRAYLCVSERWSLEFSIMWTCTWNWDLLYWNLWCSWSFRAKHVYQ